VALGCDGGNGLEVVVVVRVCGWLVIVMVVVVDVGF
jgi:hypothetical protein